MKKDLGAKDKLHTIHDALHFIPGTKIACNIPQIGILSLACSSLATAAAIEQFDYPAGTAIATANGGTGWAGPWSTERGNSNIVSSSNSISYSGIAASGNKLFQDAIQGDRLSSFIFRELKTPLVEGNTYYIRFLAQNLNEGRRYFGLALYSDFNEELLIGQSSYSPNWTVNRLSNLDSSAGVLVSKFDSSAPALLVVKLEMIPGPEKITFWVNPNLSLGENAGQPQGGGSFFSKESFDSIKKIRIGGGGYKDGVNPTDFNIDGIVIDTVSPFADTRDSDMDGLTNYQETAIYKTDPTKPDTDSDGYSDGYEVKYKSDPRSTNSFPTYRVGLKNDGRASGGTFSKSGSEGHGKTVSLVATASPGYLFKRWAGDLSGDTNPARLKLNADKQIEAVFEKDLRDTDRDGLSNYSEVVTHRTDPDKSDTDGDRISDGAEVAGKTDPTKFTASITSSLATLKVKKGKLMSRYMLTTNIGASSFAADGLPPGLKISSTTGVISGTPTKSGTYKVKLTARKNSKLSVQGTLTIQVS